MGPIRDVQIVRETQTNRSKGIAFVEFYTEDVIARALLLNRRKFMGHTLGILETRADRNRRHLHNK